MGLYKSLQELLTLVTWDNLCYNRDRGCWNFAICVSLLTSAGRYEEKDGFVSYGSNGRYHRCQIGDTDHNCHKIQIEHDIIDKPFKPVNNLLYGLKKNMTSSYYN